MENADAEVTGTQGHWSEQLEKAEVEVAGTQGKNVRCTVGVRAAVKVSCVPDPLQAGDV